MNSNYFAQNLQTELLFNENQIDTNFKTSTEIRKLFFKSKDSIQIITKIKNDSTFSVFVKNNFREKLTLIPQDNKLYLIQEALDTDNNWKPIEFWAYSDCGNSYDKKIDFDPGEIIHLTSYKYNGDFKTKIRFKILMNNRNYYSNTVLSNINTSKFIRSIWYHKIKEIFYPQKTETEAERILFLFPRL